MARRRSTPSSKLEALRISPEVGWYLDHRGIPLPKAPPLIKTPEPRHVRGAIFDPEAVDHVLEAFHHLRHTQGEWAGRPLDPDPWQVAYVLAPVFGWVRPREDGTTARIIRKLYVEVPRKNGKTTMCGGIAITMTAADHEPGAQVIAAATSERQARYLFDPIRAIAEKSPALARTMKAYQSKIVHPHSMSTFSVVSKLADVLHGANIHGAVVDELHVHRDGALLEAIETGTGSRRQPLVAIITTADDGRQATPYDLRRRLVEQVAAGTIKAPDVYGVVWAAWTREDEARAAEDGLLYPLDPFSEATWKRANPGYGISPTKEYLASAAASAKSSPAELASFLRLHLGIRTRQATKYLDLEEWDANRGGFTEAELEGLVCYGGLDLSATSDLTALCLDFPDGRGGHRVLWRHWLPEAALPGFDKRTAGMATVWVREGWLKLTPGNVVDYDFIRHQVNEDRARFRLKELGYDPWNATQMVNDLVAEGANMVQVRQGYATLSPPTKELKRLVLTGAELDEEGRPRALYQHGGNPLVRWQVDNLGVAMDPAGNVKPDKASSGEKIDGLVAAIMAVSRSMLYKVRVSAYEKRGLTVAGR
jgi:phage terminase large subunit-like protein